MLERKFSDLIWHEVVWQRPFTLESVEEMLIHLAGIPVRGAIVWEIRGNCEGARYLLGCENEYAQRVQQTIEPHGKIQFCALTQGSESNQSATRKPVISVSQLKVSKPALALRTDNALATIRAALAAMNQTRTEDELALQIVLGQAITPSPLPPNLPDPHASWLDVALGNVGLASPESRLSMKEKTSRHGFACVMRLGATVANVGISGLYTALRTLETAGVKLVHTPIDPVKLNAPLVPWHFPLSLSVKELAHFLLLPIGEEDLPGAAGLHPKLLLPPSWYCPPSGVNNDRTFAIAMDGKTRLSVSPRDSLEHAHILGGTGAGKSTLMLRLVLEDIAAGRGVLVIDPKADLVNDILARIPENRDKDVVILDPSDPCPVGFNPLAYSKDSSNATLVADAILAVFKEVFAENWGIRSQDVLSAALLTLAQCEGSSLLWLPTLLTDQNFRQRVTAQIKDKIGLEPFWAAFEAMKDTERRMEIAPVLNKIRQFLLRPGLRNVLGQAQPKFNLSDLFNKRKIVLVPLNKGIIGSESARLLGSLIVGQMWTLALSRASLPPEQRHLVSVYIDELQDYLSLPTDLSDALAQARGLGVGLTLAHQYREQLPPDIRAGIDANARNKIVFGLNAADAKAMAAMSPELVPEDFMALPRYSVYSTFQSGGRSVGWVQGKTLPAPPASRLAVELRAQSMAVYGKPTAEIEAEYLAQLGYATAQESDNDTANSAPTQAPVRLPTRQPSAPLTSVGRRKRAQDEGVPDVQPPV